MSKTTILLWFIISTAVSVLIYNTLFVNTHPLGGLNIKVDRAEIEQRSVILLSDFNILASELKSDVKLGSNRMLIRQLQVEKGLDEGNRLMREIIPAYYWDVSWFEKNHTNVTISSESRQSRNAETDEVTLRYSVNGELLKFSRHDLDSIQTKKITFDAAKAAADSFFARYTSLNNISADSLKYTGDRADQFVLKSAERRESEEKTEHQFTWEGKSRYTQNNVTVTLLLAGDLVSDYNIEETIPTEKYTSEAQSIFHLVTMILFYIVIFILIGIIAFKRIRAFEIGFRTAVIMGLTVAVLFGLELYLTISDQMGWEILLPLLIGPLMYGGAIIVLWAVGETITRETWEDKFTSMDLFTKGYSLHSQIGTAFLTGSSAGFVIASVWLLMFYIASHFFPLSYAMEENEFFPGINSAVPAFILLIHNIYSVIFTTTIFFLFLTSGLKRRFNTILPLLLTAGFLWGIVNTENVNPFYAEVLIEMTTGVLLVYLFYKTNVLTVLIALASFHIMNGAFVLFYTGNINYSESAYYLLGLFILMSVYSIITLFSRDKISDFQNITPAFVKNITERQRLQRELEIARDVQMSFLPRKNPDFRGLQVASRCVPALEVGGDYYDFIELSDKRLGIIVGDVSGKGTQAAFYMTLTKGFLKALSKLSDTSSEMLIKMNELFYENVERGTFISMIYGIFDIEKKTLTIARAGHNPVIARKTVSGTIQKIDPTGLALGLEKGSIFNRTIKEMEVSFEEGDVFVFYTDGFTEAMNKARDEYSEERLSEAVVKYSDRSADELMDIILKEVQEFMGKAKQHDDMTMVVVKIKGD